MPVFEVRLTLSYRRTNENDNLKSVPDLTDDDFNEFIINKNIPNVFKEEFSSDNRFGEIHDVHYDSDSRQLVFNMTLEKDTSAIKISDDIGDMIEMILDAFIDNPLEDSLYEGVSATYTIEDAHKFYKDMFDPANLTDIDPDILCYTEIGLIDYRKNLITVSHAK